MTTPRRKLGQTAGFAFSELMIVVLILVILLGIGAPTLLKVRRDLRSEERHAAARTLFITAQNRLSAARAAGTEGDYAPLGAAVAGEEGLYALRSDGAGVKRRVLTGGTVDGALPDGYFVLELWPDTGAVRAVFYAEDDALFAAYEANRAGMLALDKGGRRDYEPVAFGYYDGGDAAGPQPLYRLAPTLFPVNDDALTLRIAVPRPNYPGTTAQHLKAGLTLTLTVRGDASGAERTVEVPRDRMVADPMGDRVTAAVVIDSAAAPFETGYPGFTPGEDLTFTLAAAYMGGDFITAPGGAAAAANSLFHQVVTVETGGTVVYTAAVTCGRHLENLGAAPGIAAAEQWTDIDWAVQTVDGVAVARTAPFVPIHNPGLLSYKGEQHTIANLAVAADGSGGLFADFGSPAQRGTLTGVVLVDPKVTSNGDAAALVARVENTDIARCEVYLSEGGRGDETIRAAHRISGSATVGGLLGYAQNCTVSDSFSAAPYVASVSGYAGGLLGWGEGVTLTRCYADTNALRGGSAGGLAGQLNNSEASLCYALSNITYGHDAAGLAATGNGSQVRDCYAVVSLPSEGSNCYGLTPSTFAVADGAYWVSGGSASPGGGAAAGYAALSARGAAAPWCRLTPAATHPYHYAGGDHLENAPYPFPALQGLPHYNNWPEEPPRVVWLAYYEAYDNGAFGYYADLPGGVGLNTLNDSETVVADGYALLIPGGEDAAEVTYAGAPLVLAKSGEVTVDGVLCALYPMAADAPPMTRTPGGDFYDALSTEAGICYFNPDFAKTAVNGAGAPPVHTGEVSVRTSRQLARLGGSPTYWSGYTFAQERDIEYVAYPFDQPSLGSAAQPFTGVYRGGGHTVTATAAALGSRPGADKFGLFHTVGAAGRVEQLTLATTDAMDFGAPDTYGGLLAAVNGGTLQHCTVVLGGGITSENGQTGLLVGENTGRVEGCLVTTAPDAAPVASAGGGAMAGLCYHNKPGGVITHCAVRPGRDAYDGLTLQGGYVAGFCYGNTGAITHSYTALTVESTQMGSGFVNNNGGAVSHCYANAMVTGFTEHGGAFACTNGAGGTMKDCYAQGAAAGTGAAGFLYLNANPGGGAITRCYTGASAAGTGAAPFLSASLGFSVGADCFYLGAGYNRGAEGLDYGALGACLSGPDWTAGTAADTHPYAPYAAGPWMYENATTPRAYPFPALRDLPHYGNWPRESRKGHFGLYYYETYADSTTGFYLVGVDPAGELEALVHSTLDETGQKVIAATGYGVFQTEGADFGALTRVDKNTDYLQQLPLAEHTLAGYELRQYPLTGREQVHLTIEERAPARCWFDVETRMAKGIDFLNRGNQAAAVTMGKSAPEAFAVRTAQQVANLNALAATGSYYRQERDIDMSATVNGFGLAADFIPIGLTAAGAVARFMGHYDGDHHLIYNFDYTGGGSKPYTCLFAQVGEGSIQNLYLEGDLTHMQAVAGQNAWAGFIGYCTGQLTNVHARGTIHFTQDSGGSPGSERYCIAGLVGWMANDMTRCSADVDITVDRLERAIYELHLAGLAGRLAIGKTIQESWCTGDITSGGVAQNYRPTGSARGTGSIGGLVGFVVGGSPQTRVEDSYSLGKVTLEGTTNAPNTYVGQFTGRNSDLRATQVRCYAYNGGSDQPADFAGTGGVTGTCYYYGDTLALMDTTNFAAIPILPLTPWEMGEPQPGLTAPVLPDNPPIDWTARFPVLANP